MSLLIHSQPLLVLPELATKIGLNEAIILQQIHYWQSRSANQRDGRTWVYNSAVQWQEQFPFWSVNTIRRALTELRDQELVFTGCYNREPRDKTLWYSVNYAHSALIPDASPFTQNGQMEEPNMGKPFTQNGQMHQPNMSQPLPETTTENTTETKTLAASDDASDAFEVFWNAGMRKTGKAKAKAKFEAICKTKKLEPSAFAEQLCADVAARIKANQFGFDKLHPLTYLSGERWEDEIVTERPDNVHLFPGKPRPKHTGLDQANDAGLKRRADGGFSL